jgi:ABC-2 type transport system ATP-binding protein
MRGSGRCGSHAPAWNEVDLSLFYWVALFRARRPPMSSPSPAPDSITVQDLVVVYPDGTRAVNGISFRVERGEFFGFLGPNGAGKSTTIKTLTTLVRKTSGEVSVAGHDLGGEPGAIRSSIGVLSQETVVDVDLTGRENLELFGRLQQIRGGDLRKRVDELLRIVELDDVAHKPAGRYSGGMRKRLDLASALVHRPSLLFLDEPTTGLDPQSRASIWGYLERINREEGVTIFLTTQYMEEADRLCDRLAIIDQGKLIGGGSPASLKASLEGDAISVVLDPSVDEATVARAQRALAGIAGVTVRERSGNRLVANAPNAGRVIADLVTALEAEHIRPASLSMASPTLDDVFLRLTGRKIRTDELNHRETEPFLH